MVMENSNEASGDLLAHHSKNDWTTEQDFETLPGHPNGMKYIKLYFRL
jgi:hypothetical protein